MTNEALNALYSTSHFAAVKLLHRTKWLQDRCQIREAKDGVEVRIGKRWTFVPDHQVKPVRSA